MSQRQERFARLVQQELSSLISLEVKDPRVADAGLITITQVEVTGDLGLAKVHVTLHDATPEKGAELIEGLTRAAPFLKATLRSRIDSKKTPELRFYLDHGTDDSVRVQQILAELKQPK
jgi:ribosome-binding factor A